MVWCSYCAKDQIADRDDINGFTCCTGCGRVLDDNVYSSEPTFCKGSAGQSQLVGNIIRSGQYSRIGSDPGYSGFQSASHEKTLERGRNEIGDIADSLSISGRDDAVGAAHRLYVLAVEKSFTKGRRTQQVAAACLYIVCRQENKPYLLIDFSDSLQVNVYVLGAVFMQLCRLLRLEEHPIMAKPVDPSLFIHRFTDRLLGLSNGSFGRKHHAIANTALRIVASMKRDWIQTGRKPSGVCGAALFVSAQIHGFECSKSDVVSVVHVCGDTLTKRLVEFGNTESGSLTPEEFEAKAKELELQEPVPHVNFKGHLTEILCEHKELGASHHAHGLCRSCFDEFMKVSGGLEGESNPPAFQRAEKKRFDAEKRKLKEFLLEDPEESPVRGKGKALKLDEDIELNQPMSEDFQENTILETGNLLAEEGLSDLDDEEMNAYLNNEEEVRLKTVIWTEMNKEYLQELEAKEAAIAASEAAQSAALSAISSGTGSAADIAAAAAAAVASSKKARKSRKVAEKKPPAESAAEAARQMLEAKKLGSRVNFDVLDKLFDREENPQGLVDVKSSPKLPEDGNAISPSSAVIDEKKEVDYKCDGQEDGQENGEGEEEEEEHLEEDCEGGLYAQPQEEEFYEEY
ncbi:transcription factor IIIB 60 kDa subunit [Selaginella moellendorffii]|uniref:transcription factor IIIB 60 kDa subunit n=1 Tax=Selaginella moellendorffii TaxID=88036 RepID=UPI000D1C3A84|nr:transcription factor IIIB 60 kDa subunit [Selaginella moellendorffii]|eukprot:XP_002970826.2 transcription factor IIIB 60 kDa subunit [Selaginella moellendorffii]